MEIGKKSKVSGIKFGPNLAPTENENCFKIT